MEKVLVNKVANSNLITINLEDYFPTQPIMSFDIKEYLFHGLILKEKDFRLSLKELDWNQYQGAHLCIHCSADAIIPTWAYMLVSTYASGVATSIFQGDQKEFLTHYYAQHITAMDLSPFDGGRIVIKGCSDKPVPPGAYASLTSALKPLARSIMYGEPCSTVPIFKKPRTPK